MVELYSFKTIFTKIQSIFHPLTGATIYKQWFSCFLLFRIFVDVEINKLE